MGNGEIEEISNLNDENSDEMNDIVHMERKVELETKRLLVDKCIEKVSFRLETVHNRFRIPNHYSRIAGSLPAGASDDDDIPLSQEEEIEAEETNEIHSFTEIPVTLPKKLSDSNDSINFPIFNSEMFNSTQPTIAATDSNLTLEV